MGIRKDSCNKGAKVMIMRNMASKEWRLPFVRKPFTAGDER